MSESRGSASSRVFIALPGLLYCVAVASVSFVVWSLYKPVSALMWAFVLSIVVANLIRLPKGFVGGVGLAGGSLLRFTVALLGLTTSALIWTKVGVGVLAAFLVIVLGTGLSLWLGSRLGLSRRLSALIGIGTAICGASAIAALKPAVEADDDEAGIAVSGITLFGLIVMFLYPFLFLNTPVGDWLGNNVNVFAVWVGAGVHETAQVVAAAGAVGPQVAQAAMLIKSVRIFMIGPIVFLLSWFCARGDGGGGKRGQFVVPLFAVAFVVGSLVCAGLDLLAPSLLASGFDWAWVKSLLSSYALPFLFATAFAGVGSKVRFRSIMGLGLRPFAVAAGVAAVAGLAAFLCAVALAPFIAL